MAHLYRERERWKLSYVTFLYVLSITMFVRVCAANVTLRYVTRNSALQRPKLAGCSRTSFTLEAYFCNVLLPTDLLRMSGRGLDKSLWGK